MYSGESTHSIIDELRRRARRKRGRPRCLALALQLSSRFPICRRAVSVSVLTPRAKINRSERGRVRGIAIALPDFRPPLQAAERGVL